MKKFSVVIPTYNNCNNLLKPCIESIIEYTDVDNLEIIVVANGCTDNTREYVESLNQDIKLIWIDEALGFTKSTNLGIKAATGDFVILMNNDVEILPSAKNSWLTQLYEPFNQDIELGLTGPLMLWDSDVQNNFIVFWCAMIKKEMFDKVGLLDEIFNPGYGEDIDFALKLLNAGYKIKCIDSTEFKNGTNTGNFPMWHKNNQTFGKIREYKSYIVNRNKLVLRNRYNPAKIDSLNIKIGVITPTYNDQNYIKHTINMVKLQTVSNVCHYIYHDCGSDNTKVILDEYLEDRNIQLVYGKTNQGQSNARNVLIKKALDDKCTHLAFLDADDVWTIDHLELSLMSLGSADLIYSTPKFVDKNDNILVPVNIPTPQQYIGKQLMHNNFIWISSVVAKAECFDRNEFDNDLNSIEDWDMWYRLDQQGYKFANKENQTVFYLVKPTGAGAYKQMKYDLFRKKHKTLSLLKLNIGCGEDYIDDYINVDLYAEQKVDARFDISKIPYPDNSVDEIKAFRVIEHFNFFQIKDILNEWYRVLKPGGKLYLETPDFLSNCEAFVKGDEQFRIFLYNTFFAHDWFPGGAHKFLFTESQLSANLQWAGFKQMNRIRSTSKYVTPGLEHLMLTVEAYK